MQTRGPLLNPNENKQMKTNTEEERVMLALIDKELKQLAIVQRVYGWLVLPAVFGGCGYLLWNMI